MRSGFTSGSFTDTSDASFVTGVINFLISIVVIFGFAGVVSSLFGLFIVQSFFSIWFIYTALGLYAIAVGALVFLLFLAITSFIVRMISTIVKKFKSQ